jgi:hypothetical protein
LSLGAGDDMGTVAFGLGAGDDLGTVVFGLRPQATVLKSSPAPRVNSFDCSLNRNEITVYYCTWTNQFVVLYIVQSESFCGTLEEEKKQHRIQDDEIL